MKAMSKYSIHSYKEIIHLKNNQSRFDKITIHVKKLKDKNILRFAFKYALHALKIGGEMVIVDEVGPFFGTDRNLYWSKYRISFWQVKQELFKTLKNFINPLLIDESTGTIVVKKTQSYKNFKGITFGLLFSGNENELDLLKKTVSSIKKLNFSNIPYEIIVCGPEKSRETVDQLIGKINYITYNETNIRFMVGIKKNLIFSESKFDMLIISHLRIQFNDSILNLFDRKFDFITTKIIYRTKNKIYPYLDYVLTQAYNVNYKKNSNNLFKKSFDYYLQNFRNKVPYIDGGLNIFNKNIITAPPYSDEIAWGEAEDLELSARLFYNGILIDYHDDITSESLTDKVNVNKSLYQKVISELKDIFS